MNNKLWKKVPYVVLLVIVTLIVGWNISVELQISFAKVLGVCIVAEAVLYLFYEQIRRS